MAIGRNFLESFQKALRSLESNLTGIDEIIIDGDDQITRQNIIKQKLKIASPNRVLMIAQALREGISASEINQICNYDMWFIEQLENAITIENNLKNHGIPTNYDDFLYIKKMGFSDKKIAKLANISEAQVIQKRRELKVNPVYKRVDSCSAEFATTTSYMYSTYE